jgi:predicted P-loop ATPase
MSKKTEEHAISLFDNAVSTNQTQLTINDYFKGVIEGKWQDTVLKCRAITDANEQDKYKKSKVPACTVSGLFLGRKDSELQEHSGLLVIDVDEKDQTLPGPDILRLLKEIPEVFAIHYSVRGKGLAVYFRINKAKHFESFEAITKMLINDYGIVPDMHCGNIGRLRFVSYDPDCHLNYGASCWSYIEPKADRTSTNEAQYSHVIFSENDITYILSQIKERQLNIASDYYSWLRIGFGLAEKLGDGGREAFNLISSYYSGKQKTDPNKQYDRCLKAGKSGITIKSFFYYAKQAGCNLTSERTKKIITIGKVRRKQEGIGSGSLVSGKSDAKQFLIEFENINGKDVDDILEQVWQIPSKDLESEEGTLHEIELFLRSNYKFRYNEITNIVEVEGEPLNDYLFNSIHLKCKKVIEKSNKELVKDLLLSDFTPRYNPIHEFFEKHKHIRTTGNIAKLATCISSDLTLKDAQFVEYFLEKWLLSIVASAHGIYSILCLVLTGQEQGTGKTNFFKELFPEPLRWLFAVNKLSGKEADIAQLMCCKWLILDDEFGGKNKQDEKCFKELISKDVFSVRKPYGHFFEDMRRLAVLCGTTNVLQVINDLTGNRRIIPIQVNSIDTSVYDSVDKTELFIELYWKFRENPKAFFLTKSDIERLNIICFDANEVAAEMETPLLYFEKCSKNCINGRFMSSTEIRVYIEQRTNLRLSQQKLSICLKDIGYEYEQRKMSNKNIRGFWVLEKQPIYTGLQEVNNDQKTLPF